MNKVVILHGNNTYNYGSFMMLTNFIFSVEKYIIDNSLEIIIQCDTESDFIRVQNSIHSNLKITALYTNIKTVGRNPIRRVKNGYYRFVYLVYKILAYKPTAVVVLGGDDLSGCYSKLGLVLELFKLTVIAWKTDLILVSQTIGPFSSWIIPLARFVFKKCHLYLRDPLSHRYSTEVLHLQNSILSADLALLDLPGQDAITDKYQDFGLSKDEYVTVVISGLVSSYTKDVDAYVSSWVTVLQHMAEHPLLKSKKIVLLAHVLKPDWCDDRRIIQRIYCILSHCIPRSEERFVVITDVLLPVEARSVLGNGLFTISCRMHGAISSMQMGVPAICVSYSVKYAGVIGEGLGMKDLIIEAGNTELWQSGKIATLLDEKIEHVLKNPELSKRILRKVSVSQQILRSQLRSIAQLL